MSEEIIEITRSGYESLQREVESLRGELLKSQDDLRSVIMSDVKVGSGTLQELLDGKHKCHAALKKAKECLMSIVDGRKVDPRDPNDFSAGEISIGKLRSANHAISCINQCDL